MKIGLYFGSFNPIHIGHLIIANTIVNTTDLAEVWFVVSPQNPFKNIEDLLPEHDRLDLVNAAIADNPLFRASDIEFTMKKPAYTSDTLAYLQSRHPKKEFTLIMGEDNLSSFHKWKNYEAILEHYRLFVYPRPGVRQQYPLKNHPKVHFVEAPVMEISATFIRRLIRDGHSIKYLVPEQAADLIRFKKYYQ